MSELHDQDEVVLTIDVLLQLDDVRVAQLLEDIGFGAAELRERRPPDQLQRHFLEVGPLVLGGVDAALRHDRSRHSKV